MLKQKRAVSPLIATVLLIAFAVALGAVVMSWGRSYVEDMTKVAQTKADTDVECSTNVKLSFVEIGDVDQICYNDTSLEFIVEAGPSRDVSQIQVVTISGSGNTNTSSIDNSSIQKGYIRKFTLGYANSTRGPLRKVEIRPAITVDEKIVLCPKSGVSKENATVC